MLFKSKKISDIILRHIGYKYAALQDMETFSLWALMGFSSSFLEDIQLISLWEDSLCPKFGKKAACS